MSTKKKIKIIAAVIMIAVICILLGIVFFLNHIFGLINYTDGSVSTAAGNGAGIESVAAASDEIPLVATSEDVDLNDITENVMKDKDVSNILVVGQDRREGEDKNTRTRSDTMIICSLNNQTKKITMISLMRDLYVPIPGHNSNRLNSAYVAGGMDLIDATIAQDFGVKIDGNVEVDFEGFLATVSELEPLTINLTAEEAQYMTTHPLDGVDITTQPNGWGFVEGPNDLYSGALLEYARMRYVGNSDWDRTTRQRNLMKVAFEKALSLNVFSQLDWVTKVLPSITTNMTRDELVGYARLITSGDWSLNDTSYRIPVDKSYQQQSISGMSVLVPDLQENSRQIQTWVYGKVLNEVSVSSDTYSYSSTGETGQPDSSYSYGTPVTTPSQEVYTDSSENNGGYSYENGNTGYDSGSTGAQNGNTYNTGNGSTGYENGTNGQTSGNGETYSSESANNGTDNNSDYNNGTYSSETYDNGADSNGSYENNTGSSSSGESTAGDGYEDTGAAGQTDSTGISETDLNGTGTDAATVQAPQEDTSQTYQYTEEAANAAAVTGTGDTTMNGSTETAP